MIDTKQKLLDTAERLFAEQGYDATSLRHIIAEAGVNLAAIHYHFGSKEELVDEVILRKARPVNEKRLALLEQLEAEAEDRPIQVEKVLEAFMAPMAEAAEHNPQFVKLMGRMHAEGLMFTMARRHFHTVASRFFVVMKKALPELPEEEFLWRIHFMIGAMAHTMCGAPDLTQVSAQSGNFRQRISRLVAFASGGFRAAAAVIPEVEIEVKK